MNECYDKLQFMEEEINRYGGFSHHKLDVLDEQNLLTPIFDQLGIDILFKKELEKFIGIINEPEFEYHPFLRKILLHQGNYIKLFEKFGYVLSLHFKNKEAYRIFPLFFKESIKYYNIDKYKELSLLDIELFLNKYIDYKKEYNLNAKRVLTEIEDKLAGMYTDYSKYDDILINNKTVNVYDIQQFFVWSEYQAYNEEWKLLTKELGFEPHNYVKWIARNDGDGYGFDVLSYDLKNKREKLIEVKSGLYPNIEITSTEFRTLNDTIKIPNCDYYIYKYYYNVEKGNMEIIKLKYDKEKDIFIDINNQNNIYQISPYFYKNYEKKRIDVKAKIVPQEQYIKLLER